MGIHTVHVLQLREACGPQRPSPAARAAAAAGGLLAKIWQRAGKKQPQAMNAWASRLLTRPATLKFAAWVAEDAYPRIVPLLPAISAGRGNLLLATSGFGAELCRLPAETPVAVLGLNLRMESVLVRGTIGPLAGLRGFRGRSLSIDYVYNSMPPKHGQIYPPVPLQALEQF